METEKFESNFFIAKSKRTKKVYAHGVKVGTNVQFNFKRNFFPRISGLFDRQPIHKDILAFYRVGDDGIPESRKRAGFFDFSTIDLNDICPNNDYKKDEELLPSLSEDDKSSQPSSKDGSSDEDDDYSTSDSGDGEDPNDEDYDEAPWDVRLASCPEHVIYNHMPFEIHFHVDRQKLQIRVTKLIYILVKNVDN